jgi:hypothetical protein
MPPDAYFPDRVKIIDALPEEEKITVPEQTEAKPPEQAEEQAPPQAEEAPQPEPEVQATEVADKPKGEAKE